MGIILEKVLLEYKVIYIYIKKKKASIFTANNGRSFILLFFATIYQLFDWPSSYHFTIAYENFQPRMLSLHATIDAKGISKS
jgi:hypothetical protein